MKAQIQGDQPTCTGLAVSVPTVARERSVETLPMRQAESKGSQGNLLFRALAILAVKGANVLLRQAVTMALRKLGDRWAKNYLYQEWIEKVEKGRSQPSVQAGVAVLVITVIERREDLRAPALVGSLREQDFKDWTLQVFVQEEIAGRRQHFRWSRDPRIKTRVCSDAYSLIARAVEAESNEYGNIVLLCSACSILSSNALSTIVNDFKTVGSSRIAYFDEDKIGLIGRRYDAFCKPDWSPFRLLCSNYFGEAIALSKCPSEFFDNSRAQSLGAYIYELALKAITCLSANEVRHIPHVLRHVLTSPLCNKHRYENDTHEDREVLSRYLSRSGCLAQVSPGLVKGSNRVKWKVDGRDDVEIIIPTKNKHDYLERCIDSIIAARGYSEYRVSIVDTGSDEKEALDLNRKYARELRLRFLGHSRDAFNYSEVNNWAMRKSRAKYLLFMNNDTEVIDDDWLLALLEYGQQDGVGITGPKMVFPDGSIQHMGVVLGIRNGAAHIGYRYDDSREMRYPFYQAKDSVREVSAVTGACMLIRRDVFARVGGFDERFRISFNDIDLCMKVRSAGLSVVYTPYSKIIHYESVTFGHPWGASGAWMEEYVRERSLFNKIWGLDNHLDPFYNPNLTVLNESMDYRLE